MVKKRRQPKIKFNSPTGIHTPTKQHVQNAIAEINKTLVFEPKIKTICSKSEMINNLMEIQEALDVSDHRLLTPHTNWVLMKVGVEGWRGKNFTNPFLGMSDIDMDVYISMSLKNKNKWTMKEKVAMNPLSMLHFNPFMEDNSTSNAIIFQWMSDPSQSYKEVIRKMKEMGYNINDQYALNIISCCKKVLRYMQLYQSCEYGTKKRIHMTEDERVEKNNKHYGPLRK